MSLFYFIINSRGVHRVMATLNVLIGSKRRTISLETTILGIDVVNNAHYHSTMVHYLHR